MKIITYVLALLPFVAFAQDDIAITKETVNTEESASHIWFLASDELRGRETGSPEIDIAASYIASQFRKYGVQAFDGSYYQEIPLQSTMPPEKGVLTFNGESKSIGVDFVALKTLETSSKNEVVFLEYGMPDELEKTNVENKIVVVKIGKPGDNSPSSAFGSSAMKREAAKANGAIALIELYDSPALPWQNIVGYIHRSQLSSEASTDDELPHLWMNDTDGLLGEYFQSSKKAEMEISIGAKVVDPMPSKNVIGFIEGTDPILKNEYILLSAHYDHIGIKQGTNGEDSINNGARDNAIGVAAILSAAQSFGISPAKRSILLLACTGEEKGLLGSKYYADHPPVDLSKIVYNLNIDGGGYNDIQKVSVMGLHRTTAESQLNASAAAFGLETFADPAPEQNLFDRSDNVSFAAKGIPAPTYSTGFTSFDPEILKYYHQVSDHAETLDFEYLHKYFLSFSLAARLVANMPEAPFWIAGDKYEEAGKSLYGK